jgi:hypothetical protein
MTKEDWSDWFARDPLGNQIKGGGLIDDQIETDQIESTSHHAKEP